ncbi:hypothetical protein CC80DRAFT_141902 [Byssothecium circinans]|uniref:Uncharacterized protein n=1 Tax=Byssothecium circinans TaxID=147558 RepID=A0A6A5TPF3_9PLEO|nr:hypothetical protein CC80DRAFT_141902 [Byssothecium circinans]
MECWWELGKVSFELKILCNLWASFASADFKPQRLNPNQTFSYIVRNARSRRENSDRFPRFLTENAAPSNFLYRKFEHPMPISARCTYCIAAFFISTFWLSTGVVKMSRCCRYLSRMIPAAVSLLQYTFARFQKHRARILCWRGGTRVHDTIRSSFTSAAGFLIRSAMLSALSTRLS